MNYQIFGQDRPLNDSGIPSPLDRRTALLAASSLFIFGSFVGCAVYRLLGIGESELYDNLIERYFLALFYKCEGGIDAARVIAGCCFHELWMFISVFLAGFTVFSGAVSGALLLYRGLLFGFAVTMLQFSTRTGLLLDSIAYLAASFAICMLLSVMAAEASCYHAKNRIPRLKSHDTVRYILLFLRVCALVTANILAMLFLIYIYI